MFQQKDAPCIVERAGETYLEMDALQNLQHKRYPGGHELTNERFDFIVEWCLEITFRDDFSVSFLG